VNVLKRAGLLAGPLLFLWACATIPQPKIAAPFPRMRTLAVLPMDNGTLDFDGPNVVRREFAVGLAKRGYRILPLEQVDRDIKDKFGITDGGQLPSVDPKVLASSLAVDGLVYGFLDKFTDQNFGYYVNRQVTAAIRVVEGASGKDVWSYSDSFAKKDIAFSKKEAEAKLAIYTAQKVIEKVTHKPLLRETQALVLKMLSSLPPAGPSIPPPPEPTKKVVAAPKGPPPAPPGEDAKATTPPKAPPKPPPGGPPPPPPSDDDKEDRD
jgi:hypothetical protein